MYLLCSSLLFFSLIGCLFRLKFRSLKLYLIVHDSIVGTENIFLVVRICLLISNCFRLPLEVILLCMLILMLDSSFGIKFRLVRLFFAFVLIQCVLCLLSSGVLYFWSCSIIVGDIFILFVITERFIM